MIYSFEACTETTPRNLNIAQSTEICKSSGMDLYFNLLVDDFINRCQPHIKYAVLGAVFGSTAFRTLKFHETLRKT